MLQLPYYGEQSRVVTLDDRPEHPLVIQSDEIVDLKIDVETMPMEELFGKYFY